MENNPATQSILDTLRTVEFRLGLKGYNVDEVDEYLEKAAVEAESVKEQLRTVSDRLRQATERIGQLEAELQQAPGERAADRRNAEAGAASTPAADETLQRTLVLAQKFVDQIKRESEAEAAQVVAKAEERSRSMVAQAEEHARRVTSEADQRLRDEVARLEAMRTRLTGELDAMTKHMEEQRARIRESLIGALKWFDEHVPATAGVPRPADRTRGGEDGTHGGAGRGAQMGPSSTSEHASPTQVTPAEGTTTQSMPVAPSPDSTQVLPTTPPAADRAPASAGAHFTPGVTANLFENGHHAQ